MFFDREEETELKACELMSQALVKRRNRGLVERFPKPKVDAREAVERGMGGELSAQEVERVAEVLHELWTSAPDFEGGIVLGAAGRFRWSEAKGYDLLGPALYRKVNKHLHVYHHPYTDEGGQNFEKMCSFPGWWFAGPACWFYEIPPVESGYLYESALVYHTVFEVDPAPIQRAIERVGSRSMRGGTAETRQQRRRERDVEDQKLREVLKKISPDGWYADDFVSLDGGRFNATKHHGFRRGYSLVLLPRALRDECMARYDQVDVDACHQTMIHGCLSPGVAAPLLETVREDKSDLRDAFVQHYDIEVGDAKGALQAVTYGATLEGKALRDFLGRAPDDGFLEPFSREMDAVMNDVLQQQPDLHGAAVRSLRRRAYKVPGSPKILTVEKWLWKLPRTQLSWAAQILERRVMDSWIIVAGGLGGGVVLPVHDGAYVHEVEFSDLERAAKSALPGFKLTLTWKPKSGTSDPKK